jgi:hypothetical protein
MKLRGGKSLLEKTANLSSEHQLPFGLAFDGINIKYVT